MDFLLLIAWWFLSPLLELFYRYPFFFFLLLYGCIRLYRRQQAKVLATAPSQTRPSTPADNTFIDLLILRNELAHQYESGNIDRVFYGRVTEEINTLCDHSLSDLYIRPDSQRWRDGREAAWQRLITQKIVAAVSPPWQKTKLVETAQQLALPLQPRASRRQTKITQQLDLSEVLTASPHVPPIPAVPTLPEESAALLTHAPKGTTPTEASPAFLSSATPPSSSDATADAWAPTPPSVLERTLRSVSRWPALLVPFLLQNILWFICGLCFVAGSTFLISSTNGQMNTLAVSGVLLMYSSFLLWIGYRLCRGRPELIAGRVLLALGLLLIPLNIAAAVRLITTAQTTSWTIAGFLLAAVEMVGFYYATMLVSGVMDRSLQGRHPQLFLALTAAQIITPLLTSYPSWPLLAITHCILFGMLAYGVQQFTHEWLHSILAERRTIAYYAVGTLVYAAAVSFVHSTWGHSTPITLPAG